MKRRDGIHALLAETGFQVDSFDLIDGASGDITDDTVWCPLLQQLESGSFDAVFASPPCSTFSIAMLDPSRSYGP